MKFCCLQFFLLIFMLILIFVISIYKFIMKLAQGAVEVPSCTVLCVDIQINVKLISTSYATFTSNYF